jgi:hypothetical protein
VPRRTRRKRRWYRKAAEQGCLDAQVAVGNGYVNGLGVARTCGRRPGGTKNCGCLLKVGIDIRLVARDAHEPDGGAESEKEQQRLNEDKQRAPSQARNGQAAHPLAETVKKTAPAPCRRHISAPVAT